MCEFTIARGLALARFGRGERGAELRAALAELREVATRAELNSALPAIEAALAGEARFETSPLPAALDADKKKGRPSPVAPVAAGPRFAYSVTSLAAAAAVAAST